MVKRIFESELPQPQFDGTWGSIKCGDNIEMERGSYVTYMGNDEFLFYIYNNNDAENDRFDEWGIDFDRSCRSIKGGMDFDTQEECRVWALEMLNIEAYKRGFLERPKPTQKTYFFPGWT